MFEITDAQRTTAPYSSICYITCEWADGTMTRASGVIVGLNDVLTANHVVYDVTRGGYAARISISPGADTAPFRTPYGSYDDVAVIYSRTGNWDANGDGLLYPSESQYDMVVLGLRSSIGASGWLGVSSAVGAFSGTIDGYPARGTGLMEEAVTAQPLAGYSAFEVQASLGPGASGGPLLRTDASGAIVVAGVLSSGDGALTHSTYGGFFSGGNWDWLQNALTADNVVMTGGQPASGNLSASAVGVVSYLGSAFADVFRGTSANETFLGYAGIDTATFSGNRAEYFLSHSTGDVVVNDTHSGRDGGDRLSGVERAAFADMTVNLRIGDASRKVNAGELKLLEELYVAFFNRVPEADGLQFWIEQRQAGASIATIADAFYNSALQYSSLTGYTGSMSHSDFVHVIYRNVLGRSDGGDAQGVTFWSQALADGSQSRGSLVSAILQSAHTFKGDATWGWVANLLDNKAEVAQRFSVEMGLNYNTPEASISRGMEIAAAVTPTSTAAALALIGVPDTFSTLG